MSTTANKTAPAKKTTAAVKKAPVAKKPAASKANSFSGKTTTGFAFSVDKDCLDDYELFELLVKWEKGDVTVVPEAVRKLLGEEQRLALLEHCRDKSGKVRTSAIAEELRRIMATINALKK